MKTKTLDRLGEIEWYLRQIADTCEDKGISCGVVSNGKRWCAWACNSDTGHEVTHYGDGVYKAVRDMYKSGEWRIL